MKQPYLVIPVVTIVLLLYLASFALYSLKIMPKATHRKIWNTLLLVTFLITMLLGLLLAVQVNYKLDIPWIKKILVWHVNFGIGMSLAGIFHLLWNWDFYRKLFLNKRTIQKAAVWQDAFFRDKKKGFVLAVLLGFSAMTVQIVMIRELMALFGGNELVIGVVLFNWLLLTGAGAWLGRSSRGIIDARKYAFYGFLGLGILPPILLFVLHLSYHFFYAKGVAISITAITIHSLLVLLPFCLLSGFLFTFLSHSASLKKNETERIYMFENIGSIAGGVLFSFILVYFLNAFEVFAILILVLLFIFSMAFRLKGKTLLTVALIAIIVAVPTFIFNPGLYVQKLYFGQEKIVFAKETTQGKLAITSRDGQLNLYENNILIFSENNITAREEAVHYAMSNHPHPNNVLLISGGITGLSEEIEKYPVGRIDYLEPVKEVFQLGSHLNAPQENSKIHPFAGDARLFLQKTRTLYDVAIINISGPYNAMLCRYYNWEFFKQLKQKLAPGGIISTSLNGISNYAGELDIKLNSILYNTLKQVFQYVEIIPGERNYFLASDFVLRTDFTRLVEEKGIPTEYVNRYFIDDNLLAGRSRQLVSQLDSKPGISKDLFPKAYLVQEQLFQSLFGTKLTSYWPVLVLLIFPLLFLLKGSSTQTGVFAAGFASASTEFALLLIFQSTYGYVYHALGILVSCFMAGLALAAWLRGKIFSNPQLRHFRILMVSVLVLQLFLGLFFSQVKNLSSSPIMIWAVIVIFMVAEGFLTGLVFAVAVQLRKGDTALIASTTYAADIWGAALGALLSSVVLVPSLGVVPMLWVTAGIVGISIIMIRGKVS
ncbi:hypothetical protein MNBD_BACTEROID01-2737 [hydrothermal vent metagenome]|uniref:Spermidine synthase n=1 Tax=hydrothermal vent metagenome TaxID=652676 RepID=A0A3B0UHU0_9ZZZZ